jgi:zinc transport system substrate-binding protein
MKKYISIIVGLFVVGALVGAFYYSRDKDETESTDEISVATTIFPLYDLVQSVAGEDIKVTAILPAGASPHTFEPTPSTVRNLTESDAIFMIGHNLDNWVVDLANQAAVSKVVVVDGGIELKPFNITELVHDEDESEGDDHSEDEENTDSHGHDLDGIDPHYWLSPTNATIMVDNIARELVLLDPENESAYLSRAEKTKKNILNVRDEWRVKFEQIDRPIITLHDAFGYYANDLGLEITASVEPFPGREPTPRYIQELSELVDRENVRALYVEVQLGKDRITTLARDLGVEVGELDPLGGSPGRTSYIDLLNFNGEQILNPSLNE